MELLDCLVVEVLKNLSVLLFGDIVVQYMQMLSFDCRIALLVVSLII